jgi:hypothetical protein
VTPADRDRLNAEIRTHLARLDGTTASAVALLSGIPADQLDQYGGIPGDGTARPDPLSLAASHAALRQAFTGISDTIRAVATDTPEEVR